jgi:carbamoyl-phosphate synthase large subunit
VETLPKELLLEAKQKVPTDKLHMMRCLESQVHTLRMTMNINRVFKLVILAPQSSKQKHLITTRHLKPK